MLILTSKFCRLLWLLARPSSVYFAFDASVSHQKTDGAVRLPITYYLTSSSSSSSSIDIVSVCMRPTTHNEHRPLLLLFTTSHVRRWQFFWHLSNGKVLTMQYSTTTWKLFWSNSICCDCVLCRMQRVDRLCIDEPKRLFAVVSSRSMRMSSSSERCAWIWVVEMNGVEWRWRVIYGEGVDEVLITNSFILKVLMIVLLGINCRCVLEASSWHVQRYMDSN